MFNCRIRHHHRFYARSKNGLQNRTRAQKESHVRSRPQGIDIVACPPHEHASNGRAEAAVGWGKAKTATVRQTGGADESFIAIALEWIGVTSAFLPSKANQGRESPITLWPRIPYLGHHHKLRHDVPLFCLCFRATDSKQGDSNFSRKGKGCLFLGWSRISESYRLLDLETNRIIDGRCVTFYENIFPLKDRLQAGEALPSHEPIFVDGWRKIGNLRLDKATDAQLSKYCSLKGISAMWPSSAFPADAPHNWGFRAHRYITPSQTTDGTAALDVQVTAFTGTESDMSNKADGLYHKQPYLLAIPVSYNGKGADCSLRSAIAFCCPSAQHLWELADQSAARLNKLHLPQIRARDVTPWTTPEHDDVSTTTSPRGSGPGGVSEPPRIQTPSPEAAHDSSPSRKELRRQAAAERRAGTRRSPPRAPSSTGSHFFKDTSAYYTIWTPPPTPPGFRMRPRHSIQQPFSVDSIFDSQPFDLDSFGLLSETDAPGKIGFEPKTIREAKAHPSWPRWLEAIRRENTGLRERGTYVRVHRADVPKGVQLLLGMYTFKNKDPANVRMMH